MQLAIERAQVGVVARRDRHLDQAAGQPVEINLDWLDFFLLRLVFLVAVLFLFLVLVVGLRRIGVAARGKGQSAVGL
jgi:hypothetical protein